MTKQNCFRFVHFIFNVENSFAALCFCENPDTFFSGLFGEYKNFSIAFISNEYILSIYL